MTAAREAVAVSNRETIESVIRGQRRMKGTIVSMEPGKCVIAGELGEFPFAATAIKENKKFPDRQTRAGDRCDFKLSDTNPVKATSIRVIVPKAELALKDDNDLSGQHTAPSSNGNSSSPSARVTPATISGPIASSASYLMSQPINCITALSVASSGGSPQAARTEGSSGIDDLCSAFQRMGGVSGSLFSS